MRTEKRRVDGMCVSVRQGAVFTKVPRYVVTELFSISDVVKEKNPKSKRQIQANSYLQ